MTTSQATAPHAPTSPSTALARLEHVNITVSDPDRTAQMLVSIFGWHVRWEGDSIHGGRSVHVGTDDDYLALYTMGQTANPASSSYGSVGGLNHIALVVEDLDGIEQRVIDAGYQPTNHGDYEPGRRFYFWDHDEVEYEIVSYA